MPSSRKGSARGLPGDLGRVAPAHQEAVSRANRSTAARGPRQPAEPWPPRARSARSSSSSGASSSAAHRDLAGDPGLCSLPATARRDSPRDPIRLSTTARAKASSSMQPDLLETLEVVRDLVGARSRPGRAGARAPCGCVAAPPRARAPARGRPSACAARRLSRSGGGTALLAPSCRPWPVVAGSARSTEIGVDLDRLVVLLGEPDQPDRLADLRLDLVADVGVLGEERRGRSPCPGRAARPRR